ncbi:MAG: hypothetical protein WA397_03440 [Roseiarcus sp.]
MRVYLAALVVLAGLCGASVAGAADLPTKKPAPTPIPQPVIPSAWRVEITGYGWGSSIAGSTGFGSLPTLPYYASFGKVLEHFQGSFMGSVVARNDTFIAGIDFVWARIGGSGVLQNPDSVLYGGKTSLTLNEGFITAFGGVRVPLGIPNLSLYGTVGARNFYAGTKLTVSGPFGLFNGTETVNKDWVNPVAGFAAQYRYGDRWFMNMLADLGGWSDSATGQALTSVGYNWTQNIATTVGYRVMYNYTHQDTGINAITLEPRSFRYQQWMYGPFAGFKYSF